MPFADYRCEGVCGKTVTLELPQDEVVMRYCCEMESDGRGCVDHVQSPFRRVWTTPSIGAVSGAGGSPARTGGSKS